MMAILRTGFPVLALALLAFACGGRGVDNDPLLDEACRLAQETIIIDSHIDLPYRLEERMEDVGQRTESGDFDYPRAREGGLDLAFASIFVPPSLQETGGERALADRLIDLVEGIAEQHPDRFFLATSVQEVTDLTGRGRVALALGMENGAGIEGDLSNLAHFQRRGVRYITLAHGKANRICDSSYDEQRPWGGLSPFGREVVLEMNRLGIMIDVSHVTDDTFFQVLELTRAPVIASHSCCRHFTPGFERNMSDEMIRSLAGNGGVIQIAFVSSFLDDDIRAAREEARGEIQRHFETSGISEESDEGRAYREAYYREHSVPVADVAAVADHIDHVVGLVGIDHVGLGSDFDGLGESAPTGLKSVAEYPNLIRELLARGYTAEQVEKICSGNLLRVWAEVERLAEEP
jgi:membrane dipeptidase